MCEESVPYLPVSRLIVCSDFGYYFGCVNDAASKNIHEVIYLGIGLVCNDDALCSGSMYLKIDVRDISEQWK